MFESGLAATAAAMVAAGEQIADAAVLCLKRALPAALPWPLSFSDGRALQALAQKTRKGQRTSVPAAQKALFHRAKMNGAACLGRNKAEMEKDALAA